MAPPPPPSSLLLCVSMFLAVSSVGKALSSDHIPYVEPDDYYYQPAPAWEDEWLWGCPAVTRYISTCLEYLKGHQDTPSSACCENVGNLVGLGIEVGFQRICDCTKDLRRSFVQRRAQDEIYKLCNYWDHDDLIPIPIARGQCPRKTHGASTPTTNAL